MSHQNKRTSPASLKPRPKPYKYSYGKGLYLLVQPAGGKYWRVKYRVPVEDVDAATGTRSVRLKEKTAALGTFPEIRLVDAEAASLDVRRLIMDGKDPVAHRRAKRLGLPDAHTFESVAREWYRIQSPKWKPSHGLKVLRRLERFVFPHIGKRGVADIAPMEVLECVKRIEASGHVETAHRTLNACHRVFHHAVVMSRARTNPAYNLSSYLTSPIARHFATILDDEGIGALLRAIDGYQGHAVTRAALKLAPMVFVRPGELRGAEWSEIDLDNRVWLIPAHRMKGGRAHIVPLSAQAAAILQDLQPLTGSGRYLFPSIRHRDRPMSDNTINAALRALGYPKDKFTGHGFRAMASSKLNATTLFPADAIERQLAHVEANKVRAAYHREEYLEERRRMMQLWSDKLVEWKERI